MKQGIHFQILESALKDMYDVTDGMPTRMFAPAKIFADEATLEEITSFEEVFIDDAKSSASLQSALIAGSICSMMSQEKASAIAVWQISNQNSKINTAYQMGALRWSFIKDYLLGSLIEEEELNRAMLSEALDYYRNIKWISDAAFTTKLQFSVPSLKIALKVDPNETQTMGAKARRSFEEKLSKDDLSRDDVKSMLGELAPSESTATIQEELHD